MSSNSGSFDRMVPPFHNPTLLETALTHRSALNESDATESNERLEFLGDAVLELITTEFLYEKYPQEPEGVLTSYRAALVKTTTLAIVTRELHLDTALRISKGEERSGGRDNTSLLADTFEAVVGALYLDQGYEACRTFLMTHLLSRVDQIVAAKLYKDYKTTLQEYIQAQGQSTPAYTTVDEQGPDHQKIFTVNVVVETNVLGTGSGRSKQEASQEAARDALEKLGKS